MTVNFYILLIKIFLIPNAPCAYGSSRSIKTERTKNKLICLIFFGSLFLFQWLVQPDTCFYTTCEIIAEIKIFKWLEKNLRKIILNYM